MKSSFALTSAALIISVLAACSSSPRKAEGGFEYTRANPVKSIEVPTDYDRPVEENDFDVPKAENIGGYVGESVSVLPPRLLIPAAVATHVDEKDPVHTIWFEQTEDVDNLEQEIWSAISSHYEQLGVELRQSDRQNGFVETGWVPHEIESGWWLWSSIDKVESRRYSFQMAMKPHGRSGSVKVKILDRRAEGLTLKKLFPEDEPGIATDELNRVVAHYDYRLRLESEKLRIKYSAGVVATASENSKGESVLLVEAPFPHAWTRMLQSLDSLGFLLTDINKLEGRIYARAQSSDDGFWSFLFGDDEQVQLDLEAGDYVIEFVRLGEQTSVLFNNNNLEPLSPETMAKIVPEFIETLAVDLD